METIEYEIKKIGKLKYPKLKSLSVFRNMINSYEFSYTMSECKESFYSILDNTFTERFDMSFKICIDEIFENTDYIVYDDNPYKDENNFPKNWIGPIG